MYVGVLHISRKLFPYLLLLGVLVALIFLPHTFAHATTGINQQLNFEGRLLSVSGATVPDGYYNIQFKIYQDGDGLSAGDTTGSPAGTLDWSESYLNASSQGVQVINGFMSVQLGSITPFGSSVNWNQSNLWLSINIAGISPSCTPFSSCSPDGEMLPMKRLSASPYALNSGQLGGLTSAQFLQIAQGVQTDVSTSTNSIYLNKTGAGGNFIDLQSAATDVFTVGSAGDLTFGANANHTLSVATSAAGTAGKNLTVSSGNGGTGTGSTGGTLALQGGTGGGTNGIGGNVTIDAGSGTGSGAAGTISIGATTASTIQIGDTTVGSGLTQTVNIGNNGAAGTTNVNIGSGSGSTGGTTAIQSKGSTTLATNGTTRATFDTTGNLYLGDGTTSTGTGTFTVLGSTGATGNDGYSLNLQGGTSGTGAVNGGSVSIQGGATSGSGVQGLVKLSTSSFTSAANQSFAANGNVTQANIDNNSAIDVSSSVAGPVTVTIPPPTTKVSGRLLYVLVTGANPVILSPNGGTAVTMNPNTAVTLVWNTNTNGWLNAGADSGDNSYIQNQTAVSQTAGFKINGVGTAASFVGSSLDVASASTLSLGTATANAVTVGNTTTATTTTIQGGVNGVTPTVSIQAATNGYIAVGTANVNTIQIGAVGTTANNSTVNIANSTSNVQTVNIGGTASTSTTTIKAGVNGTTPTISIQGAANAYLALGTTNVNTIQIGAVGSTANASVVQIGVSSGAVQTLTAGSTASTSTTTIQGGVNGTTPTISVQAATNGYIAVGTTNANTINVGAVGSTANNSTVNIANSTAGIQTVGIGSTNSTSAVTIQGGVNGTNNTVSIQAATNAYLAFGTTNANTVNIGTLNSAGTTNVTVGSASGATAGITTIQSKGNTTIATNGVARATFDTSGNLYVGNGPTSVSPANFTIQGTASTASGVAGGTVTVQGGNATTGTANGGNLVLSGGTAAGSGANGLVVLTTTSAQTVNDSNCYNASVNCTISLTSLNNNSAIIAGFPTVPGQTVTLPDPPITTAGRQVYITASNGSQDFTLIANSGAGAGIEQDIAMRQNTSATMVWNGSDWTAAGASSSTTLQSAYNNTLQSAGGAELVVSKTSSTNGLTIRDSTTASVNGTLLQVQSKTAANLFSVSSNVSDYASDNGAETAGGSSTTFPANTWSTSGTGVTLTRYTTTGNYIATGQASTSVQTSATANTGVKNQLVDPTSGSNVSLTANTQYNVSFSTRLLSGTFTTLTVYYSINGTTQSVPCINSQTAQTSITSSWSKINCSFTAPTSGETTSNAILIQQSDATARTFYVDNLSVTIAAGQNYATDGGVDSVTGTNWVSAGAGTVAVSQNTSDGNDTSDSAQAVISTNTAAAGLRNKLSIFPLTNTLYRMTVYAKLNSGAAFTDFKVRYSPDGGTNYVDCVDYNTQTVVTTSWTPITCYVNTIGTTVSNPYAYFVQTAAPGGARTFSVDTFSMTLASSTTPDVQIGSGTAGGPVTLFTLDSAASAPIAANNTALYGSMYYDTTQGKIQCYQAAGWGACGASPDSIVTISPEYTNAVMHGTGVGTMVSDFCSGASGVNINDGTSGQPSICGSTETYNFYKWTSPQPTAQAYSIYVTYQLPSTFKQFTSGQTSLQARVDSTSNAFVKMQIYKNHSGLTTCGGNITITTTASTWQYPAASGTADPSTCGFSGGDSIVFKITTSANSNANAYVGNLNFTFSNS